MKLCKQMLKFIGLIHAFQTKRIHIYLQFLVLYDLT